MTNEKTAYYKRKYPQADQKTIEGLVGISSRNPNEFTKIARFIMDQGPYARMQATIFFQEATDLCPDNPDGFGGLGWIHFEANELTKAEEYFLKALEVDPKSLYALTGIMRLYDKLGRSTEAAKYRKIHEKEFAKSEYAKLLRDDDE